MTARVWNVVLVMLLAAFGCSGTAGKSASAVSDDDRYMEAMEKLIKGDHVAASQKFEALAGSTLNPLLVQLSTLRLGDALFFQGNHAEAAEVYREYLVQFPTSPDAPHAFYMRGLCFFEKMPGDSWILPPAESREMDDVMNAYANFAALVDQYPSSFYALRARAMLVRTVERRCRYHLYVAHYYRKNGKPLGVVQRMRQALDLEARERDAGHVPESFFVAGSREELLMLAKAYESLKDLAGLQYTRETYVRNQKYFRQPEKGLAEIDRRIESVTRNAQPPASTEQ